MNNVQNIFHFRSMHTLKKYLDLYYPLNKCMFIFFINITHLSKYFNKLMDNLGNSEKFQTHHVIFKLNEHTRVYEY